MGIMEQRRRGQPGHRRCFQRLIAQSSGSGGRGEQEAVHRLPTAQALRSPTCPVLAGKMGSLIAGQEFQHILRLLNTNVDGKTKIMYALTSIKGIGRRFSNLCCKKAEVDMKKRAGAWGSGSRGLGGVWKGCVHAGRMWEGAATHCQTQAHKLNARSNNRSRITWREQWEAAQQPGERMV